MTRRTVGRVDPALQNRHEAAWDAHFMDNRHPSEDKPWSTVVIMRPGDNNTDYISRSQTYNESNFGLTDWDLDVFEWLDQKKTYEVFSDGPCREAYGA